MPGIAIHLLEGMKATTFLSDIILFYTLLMPGQRRSRSVQVINVKCTSLPQRCFFFSLSLSLSLSLILVPIVTFCLQYTEHYCVRLTILQHLHQFLRRNYDSAALFVCIYFSLLAGSSVCKTLILHLYFGMNMTKTSITYDIMKIC